MTGEFIGLCPCGRPAHARGLCARDYARALRDGVTGEHYSPDRQCQTCGENFTPILRSQSIYCGEACRSEARRLKRNESRARRLGTRVCPHCRRPMALSVRANAKFCSVSCQQAAWYDANADHAKSRARQWAKANKAKRTDYGHRRRANQYGTRAGSIDLEAVWLRDGGRCWLCAIDVDADLVHPDPMSGSLDHVIPLSQGGPHTMGNVALAHLRCNLGKKDKIPDRRPIWWPSEEVPGAMAS